MSTRTRGDETAQLRRSVGELSMLNDLAAEIGRSRGVDEITRAIIRKARIALGAAEGDITLLTDAEQSVRKTLVRTRVDSRAARPLRVTDVLLERIRREARPIVVRGGDDAERTSLGLDEAGIRTLVSVPLLVGGRLTGILTVYNRGEGRDFSAEDVRLLSIMASQSAQVVERARVEEERRAIIDTFGQFISPAVVEEILRTGTDTEGVRRHVCVLFMDVRGFSLFAETAPPEVVVEYLRTLFGLTIECVNRHHGMVHQLLGDGMMAVFGTPVSHPNNAANAVTAALEMIHEISEAIKAGGIPATKLGIGLHAGDVVAGTIGSAVHREYTVTGDVVNVAARIEKLNKEFDSTLLISKRVYDELDPTPPEAVSLGSIPLVGRRDPVHLYRLL